LMSGLVRDRAKNDFREACECEPEV
jgi:hypothetical protein